MTTAHRPTFDPVRTSSMTLKIKANVHRPVAKKPSEALPTINVFSQPTPSSSTARPAKAVTPTKDPPATSPPSFSLPKPPISPRRMAPLPSWTMPMRTMRSALQAA